MLDRINALSPEKRRLLAQRLDSLAMVQEPIWFLHRFAADVPAYNIPLALSAAGPLDDAVLARTMRTIATRHEILRTTFPSIDGQPVQLVDPEPPVSLPIVDLGAIAGDRVGPIRQRVIDRESRRIFDIERGPLWRCLILRRSDAEHVLMFTVHHLIFDGWSRGVLLGEFTTCYRAFVNGETPALPALPIQYRDFTRWHRARFEDAEFDDQFEYWEQQLRGPLPELELPTDRPRPPQFSYRGADIMFAIPAALTQRLTSLARAEGVSLFMVLLAGWTLLLHRHSQQNDIIVGTATSGRTRRDCENLIGCFINALPMRVSTAGNPTVRELIGRVREVALGAYAHQDVPFERLVAELQPERRLDRSPIFTTSLMLLNTPPATGAGGSGGSGASMRVQEVTVNDGTARFDLALAMMEMPDGLLGPLRYATDLFDAPTIHRMLGHLTQVFEGIVAHPERRISELPLLTAAERREMEAWNDRACPWTPPSRSALDLFDEAAARAPDAVAVVDATEQWDYRTLHERAGRTAAWLRGASAARDTRNPRVGVCMRRSSELIAAVLAVLKAGAAYVPLDPSTPRTRLAFQLADAGVSVVLTDRASVDVVPPGAYAVHVVGSDADVEANRALAAPDADATSACVHVEDLAYIIYTSGSTGQPKGVMVTHGGLLNYLCWVRETYPLAAGQGTLFHSSLAFDLTVTSVLAPLAAGGTIRIVDGAEGVEALADAFRQTVGLGFVKATPSHLHALETVLAPAERGGRTRAFVVGGEALGADLVERWLANAPSTVLFNEYGPTETVVGCCVQRLAAGDVCTDPVSIGYPIANTQLHVVSPEGQLAPIGMPGELWIGGAGVARGYVNRPDLTADRFVPDPFGSAPGRRLYRTGDRVRRRTDGALEYLGRFDDQVKLRGHRIELGEIEVALRQQAGIRAAAVVLREDVPGTPRLVGYVVGADDDRPRSADALQSQLRTQLPDYMVPAAIVWLDALPLTPNGKVDRRQLRAPGTDRPAPAQGFAAPRTAVESTLARIWAEVLRLERVGIHDNFFALGGDSIVSLQIVARALQAGLRIAPRQVFAHQTIAALAPMIETAAAAARVDDVTPLAGSIPQLPMQRRFFGVSSPAEHHYNQQARLALPAGTTHMQFAQAWGAVVQHHNALRFRFLRTADGWTQTIGAEVDVDRQGRLSIIDLTAFASADEAFGRRGPKSSPEGQALQALQQRAASAVQASLDLAESPWRVVLLRLPGGAVHALFVIHHLVVDGVSWRVLLMDLQDALRQLDADQPIALPPKSSSVREWAEALHALAASGALADETTLWTEMTAPAAILPRDAADGINTVRTARAQGAALSEEETQAILQELPGRGVGHVQELLLTALVQTLTDWTRKSTWRIDLEGHGREDLPGVDVSRTVGWLTSLYPVRVTAAGDPLDTLRAIKTRLRAIPRYGLGYGVLRYLDDRPETRAIREAPGAEAEVIFNYLGQTAQALAPERHGLRPAPGPAGHAVHLDRPRDYLFEITAIVVDNRMRVSWVYGGQLHRPDTIERLTASFVAHVRALIVSSRETRAERRWLVPADFPLAGIDAAELEVLAARGAIEDVYPLSPMQEGLLFHCVYERDEQDGRGQRDSSLLYTVRYRAQIEGPLDAAAFQCAWQTVTARHDILRTAFLWKRAGRPLQAVYRDVDVPCAVEDWRALSAADREARLAARLAEDDRTGFDLERAPLMRLDLVRLEDDRWHAGWTLHHLITDGWSVQLVMSEVLATYNARVAKQPQDRPQPPDAGRYRDYIAWLQRQDLANAEAFWRRTLHGVATPSLIGDAVRGSALATTATQSIHGAVSQTAMTQLQTFGRAQALTMNTCLVGGWALVLAHRTGSRDVVCGTVVSGRPPQLRGIEKTPGMFVNTLPLRARVAPAEALGPWLRELQAQQTDARDYEYTPLGQIQRWSDVPPAMPLFDTLFAYENYPVTPARQPGTGVRVRRSDGDLVIPTTYPIVLELAPSSEAIGIRMTFDRTRVPEPLARELLDRYQLLLEHMASTPKATLSALLDVLATAEADAQAHARVVAQQRQQTRLRALRRDVPVR